MVKETGFKIDLHVHTEYSEDSVIDPRDLARLARNKGLRGIAITDHGTMEACGQLSSLDDVLIIRGVETYTNKGHMISLFVEEPPKSNDLDEAIDQTRAQGGLTIMAHPFGFPRLGYVLGTTETDRYVPLARRFDAIEVCNSRVILPVQNDLARELAAKARRPATGGSDCHLGHELGNCYTLFEDASSEDDVYRQLKNGNTAGCGGLSSPMGHALSLLARVHKIISGQ